MLSGMIELAKQLGQPAIYLVLSLIMLVWGARSYVSLRKSMSHDYRESVQETLNIVSRLQSETKTTPELEPIKNELLRRLGVVNRTLDTSRRYIISDDASVNAFLAPEPMLVMGAASALVMLVTNSAAQIFNSTSRSYIAVVLSFVIALLIFKTNRSWPIRLLYYVMIETAIFAMAAGLNAIGLGVTHGA